MKRVLIADMPWPRIQVEYDSGLSTRDICVKFKTCQKTLAKARKLGYFIPRNSSASGKMYHLVKPRDYSEQRNRRPALTNYRDECAFRFNLSEYPNEFDFYLIEQFGWYKPKNRGDNLTGVSRDHLVSVRYGFDNSLPAEHLAHPANCRLLQHGKNSSKGMKSSITYPELLSRIKVWNKKYGDVS